MKALLSKKVKRGEKLSEWISSAEQATDDGRLDFAERQRKRRAEAEATRTEATAKTVQIRKVRA